MQAPPVPPTPTPTSTQTPGTRRPRPRPVARRSSQLDLGLVELVEIARVNGWRMRRCDAARLLVAEREREQAGGGDQGPAQAWVLVCTPREYQIIVALLRCLGEPVPLADLLVEGATDIQRDRHIFHKHLSRLRKKIRPLGIVLRWVEAYGYIAQSQ